jgi:DNA-binding transcriptional LysR family regulator
VEPMPLKKSAAAEVIFNWDDIRLFLALFRSKTLSSAAKLLRVDVSTVSRRLTAFESDIGVRLFERSAAGLVPNAFAEELLPAAERTEAAACDVARAQGTFEQQAVGVVRLACLPMVAEWFLVPTLGRLADTCPGLTLHINAGSPVVDLTRNEADVAIRSVRPARGDLVCQKLLEYRYVLTASASMAHALGEVSEVATLKLIHWTPQFGATASARWPALCANSMHIQLAAAAAGLGVALVPEPCLPMNPGLVPLRLRASLHEKHPLPSDTLWVIGHRALRGVPRVDAVWSHIVAEFAAYAKAARAKKAKSSTQSSLK